METKQISGLDVKEIKSKEYNLPYFKAPIFQPYSRVAVYAPSGGGKTNSFLHAFEWMYPTLDHTYVFSTSYYNDPKQVNAFGRDRPNITVITEPSLEAFADVVKEIDQMNEDHRQYLKFAKAYKKWKRDGEASLSNGELLLLYKYDFEPSNLPYNKLERPNILLWMDDLQGSDLLKSRLFESFYIKSRHKNCSSYIAVQTWKGMKPTFRRNCSGWMIFKSNDINQLKSIYEEISGLFKGWDDFYEKYRFATEQPFSFMYIDTKDKDNGIRKNFNEVIL